MSTVAAPLPPPGAAAGARTAFPWRVYLEFSRVSFVNILAFRLRYYTGILTYFINVTVYYFIWKAIYASAPTLAGFNFRQIVTYVAVGWMIRSLYFNNIDQDMAQDVMEGKISMVLIKPVSVQRMYLSQALGETAFRAGMLSVPVAAVLALVFPVQPPRNAGYFILFLISLIGSVLLVATLNFIVGTCAIRLKSILGLLRAKFFVQELLSGLLIPMTMFPAPLQTLLAWLPFEHIGYTPMLIYLGRLSYAQALGALAVQALWVVALAAFGAWFWKAMSRKLTIHGG
ncbi:MAG TPA: ABC-2 family transporter protein [Bryobacterales bacterium]|nr:ABC-2 family transporter protein [Bryobacterales bacterium]